MDFTYGGFQLFSKIETLQPILRAELGQYVLEFDTRFLPNNPSHPQYPRNGALVVSELRVSVSLRDTRRIIGIAEPAIAEGVSNTVIVRPQFRQTDISVRFHLFLAPAILEAVEASRKGGDLHLALKLSGTVTGYDSSENEKTDSFEITWGGESLWNAPPARIYRPQQNSCDLVVTVLQSKWVELITGAGFARRILLEIPVLEPDELGVAATHVQGAQAALTQGRYADVVSLCRDAMDALIEKPSYPWKELGSREWREGMAVEDRLRLGWNALRHITHATHHRNGIKGEFTRPIAQYVLGTTLLTLSLATRESDLFLSSGKVTPQVQEN